MKSHAFPLLATMIVLACTIPVIPQEHQWRLPPAHEQLLTESVDCWEPALAVGPRRRVYVVAGRRTAPLRSANYDQKLVIWRSDARSQLLSPVATTISAGPRLAKEPPTTWRHPVVVVGRSVAVETSAPERR